jgi:hypothetical protein
MQGYAACRSTSRRRCLRTATGGSGRRPKKIRARRTEVNSCFWHHSDLLTAAVNVCSLGVKLTRCGHAATPRSDVSPARCEPCLLSVVLCCRVHDAVERPRRPPAWFAPLVLTRQSTIPPTFFGCTLETARQAWPRRRGAAIARRDDEPGCVKPTPALRPSAIGEKWKTCPSLKLTGFDPKPPRVGNYLGSSGAESGCFRIASLHAR